MSIANLKILVCDDHELIREGLKRILQGAGLASSIGEASNGHQAIQAVRREEWNVLLLDINLCGRSGLEVLKTVKAEFPTLPVLILSIYPETEYAVRAIRAGASGYLNKNAASRDLLEAIRQVSAGRQYVNRETAALLIETVKHPAVHSLHATLSDREDQVLRLIGAGNTVGEIAKLLDLSVKTVSTYRALTLRKLALKNNAQLMRYVQQYGLS